MKLALFEEKVRQTIRKNTAASYGLTLAIGLPFPDDISHRIQQIQQQLESVTPGRFAWYGLDHLHATLVAPMRGRYRDYPALQQEEMPIDFQRFSYDLINFFSRHPPFSLELAGVRISDHGFVLIVENTFSRQLTSILNRHPEFDQPKHFNGLHVAIGYFNTARPFATNEEIVLLEAALTELAETYIGSVMVRQIWLVHYANRTLSQIVGKVEFNLGKANVLTSNDLLRELGILSTISPGRYTL
ncbi:MAG: hypothetical protein KDI79_24645 [Anaerolineae bacterium]|nr:hypothetical protein [Anaerolineae bacterium]